MRATRQRLISGEQCLQEALGMTEKFVDGWINAADFPDIASIGEEIGDG